MAWTIERLRAAIVVLAVLLLVAIVGSLFYGRWRLRHLAQDLPARLGLQIQQSTQGFVLSKTEQGRPVFTLHAARAVEFKSGGRVSLHDVEIDLYNRQDGQADTIAGNDFEFDPRSQIVESRGEARIVLHAPETNAHTGSANKSAGQLVRVITHGLTFDQKTGVATCSGEVDFQTAAASGQAVGAVYDSKQGHLVLESNLTLTTNTQKTPAVLHASRATYDRNDGQVHLWQPRYSSRSQSGRMSGMAGTATVLLRPNGSAEHLDAQDGVRLASTDGMAVEAKTMHVLLNGSNQPQAAHFSGGVEFTGDRPTQKTSGNAHEAEVDFDAQGRADRVNLDGEVRLHQQTDLGKGRLQRALVSNHLLLQLLPTRTGQAQLQSADATGDAIFTSQSTAQPMFSGHAQETTVSAQTLKANFATGNQLQQLNGTGQTRLQTVAANGDIDSSTGDTLHIEFAPSGPATPRSHTLIQTSSSTNSSRSVGDDNPLAKQSIRTAVQTGHVVLRQTSTPNNGETSGPRNSMATAARASYIAANDTLTLTGKPGFSDAQLEMTADRMEVERAKGRMVSTGAVQATLRASNPSSGSPVSSNQRAGGSRSDGQPRKSASGLLGGNQPVHIIAEKAIVMHDSQNAVFSGRARLWQGGDTVEAPVIDLSQKMQTLTAYGNQSCTRCVISNFVGAPAGSVPPAKQKPFTEQKPSTDQKPFTEQKPSTDQKPFTELEPSTFRVLSDRLVYSDAERKASFIHNVQVISSSGQLVADNADIFLTPANMPVSTRRISDHPGSAETFSSRRNAAPQSSVEKIVATGHVRLQQPGRSATGARLVYTAADGRFVLTGDEKNPPEVVDLDRGTVTGQVLTFASPEQAIMVSGTVGHTATTKTRVQKK